MDANTNIFKEQLTWVHAMQAQTKTKMKLDIHVTVHRDKILIIKPTRCTNFSNLFLKLNSTCFGQFLCPSSGVFHCTHSNGICHTGLLTVCELSANPWHIPLLCVQWKTPDDGQKNRPKHVEFHFKNKFEKSVHLVGFIIRKMELFTHGPMVKLRILQYRLS